MARKKRKKAGSSRRAPKAKSCSAAARSALTILSQKKVHAVTIEIAKKWLREGCTGKSS